MPRSVLSTLTSITRPIFTTIPSDQRGCRHGIILSHWTVEGTKVKDGTGARFWIETQPLGAKTTQDIVVRHTGTSPFDLPAVMTNAHCSASARSPAACRPPHGCGGALHGLNPSPSDPRTEGCQPRGASRNSRGSHAHP